jgi:hypothetical protein
MSAWEDRLRESDWSQDCYRDGCERTSISCPVCKHGAHKRLWVDLDSDNKVIVVAQHSHFVRQALADVARNWNHKIETRVVDRRSFEMKRVVEHREFLPADIRRIFDER